MGEKIIGGACGVSSAQGPATLNGRGTQRRVVERVTDSVCGRDTGAGFPGRKMLEPLGVDHMAWEWS